MKKTIKLENGKELTLDNNLGWLMEYQNQFGIDIIPTLMPLILAIGDFVGGLADAGADFGNMDINDGFALLNSDAAIDAGVKLGALSSTDIINIIWAMAKTADDEIPEPKKWVRGFEDGFPLDLIMPPAAELIARGVMSSKNFDRLTAAIKSIKPLQPKKETKKSK